MGFFSKSKGISDHDAMGIRYGAPEERIERDLSMYRMSFSFIRQLGIVESSVRKDVEDVLRRARESTEIAASCGNETPPGWLWNRVKRDIHINCMRDSVMRNRHRGGEIK